MRGYNDTDKPVGIRNYDSDSVAGIFVSLRLQLVLYDLADVAEAIEQLGEKYLHHFYSKFSNFRYSIIQIFYCEFYERPLGGRTILVGHDWGALICWLLAMQRPELIADRMIIMNVPHPKAFMKTVRTKSTQLLKSWYVIFM